MIRKATLAACLALGLTTSCLGPNNAHNSLRNWNAELSEQDWINEVVFLVISPVHMIALAGDVLIFNTIDYWGDDNPIGDPGAFPSTFGD